MVPRRGKPMSEEYEVVTFSGTAQTVTIDPELAEELGIYIPEEQPKITKLYCVICGEKGDGEDVSQDESRFHCKVCNARYSIIGEKLNE
jgi:hypothetical protein